MLTRCLFFFIMTRLPPSSTLFPYTTLFRSHRQIGDEQGHTGEPRRGARGSSEERAHRSRKVSDDPQPARAERLDRAHRSEEHTSELQSRLHLVCRLLLEKKKKNLIT